MVKFLENVDRMKKDSIINIAVSAYWEVIIIIKWLNQVNLLTKILVLIIGLILFVTILLTGFYSYMEAETTEEEIGEHALQTAKMVANMPSIREGFSQEDPEETIQPVAEEMRELAGAEFIVIGNTEGIRYSHPDKNKLGKHMVGGDNDAALIDGESYVSRAEGSLGPSLRGKTPVWNYEGEIVGVVSVGYMIKDINAIIFDNIKKLLIPSIIVLIIGAIGGLLLTKNIRSQLMGFEPHKMTSLYRQRNAILSTVHEGIISVNANGIIQLMNQSAEKLLDGKQKAFFNQPISKILPELPLSSLIESGQAYRNKQMEVNDRHIIFNMIPIYDQNQMKGAVLSFRDKTELKEMIDTLGEVRSYSEELRAQTHEYTNRLYVLSGMLQLGNFEEAIELIQKETQTVEIQNKIVYDQISDKTVQAILLGKIGKASELKINFLIDDYSSLSEVTDYVEPTNLITILGNVIDNALDAVRNQENGTVHFFSTDIGHDYIFEVADNGLGIDKKDINRIFHRRFSTKDKVKRGYGLATVRDTIDNLHGRIEVKSNLDEGTIFTIFIPKHQSKKTG
ncbi:ATP-binding protein [Oceanobacillus sojae]|uniref:ATP-binding protein n=1 Tax=Oceanobacillus sojae TaxID=582851 RepID=UPI0020C97BF6|nr:sensor histidine kinase [Oceanobacillus sojae]MCT1902773.1 sensor histidine kinase [Oceanobacillus sojae]